jgi:hypothetical protein
VPSNRQQEVADLFGPEATLGKTASRTGKYVSITVEMSMDSSARVIEVYKRAATIQGIVML